MMANTRIVLLACVAWFWTVNATAFEIEQVETKYRDKQYQLTLEIVLDARSDRVQAVLRDYRNYPQLDGRILDAEVLKRTAANEVLLYTRLRACFGVFCRNVKRVERVTEFGNDLQAVVLPEQSEVLSGETRMRLTPLGERTRVSYATSIAPGIWIPPFVGRPLMLRTLREASVDLFRNVERRAQSMR